MAPPLLGVQQIPVARKRIALDEHDVGNLSRLERAELIGHLDVRRRVRTRELHAEYRHAEADCRELLYAVRG